MKYFFPGVFASFVSQAYRIAVTNALGAGASLGAVRSLFFYSDFYSLVIILVNLFYSCFSFFFNFYFHFYW